jgi:hypothetical protein
MGGGNSKNIKQTTDITNSLANTISKDITNTCSVKTGNTQSVVISGINSDGCSVNIGGTITLDSKIDNNCINKSMIESSISSALKNLVDTQINSESGSSIFEIANQQNVDLLNKYTQNLTNTDTVNSISNCINDSLNNQTYEVSNSHFKCNPIYDANGNPVPDSYKININPVLNIVSNNVTSCLNDNLMTSTMTNILDQVNKNNTNTISKDAFQTAGEGISTMAKGVGEGLASAVSAAYVPFIVVGVIVVALIIGAIATGVKGKDVMTAVGAASGSSGSSGSADAIFSKFGSAFGRRKKLRNSFGGYYDSNSIGCSQELPNDSVTAFTFFYVIFFVISCIIFCMAVSYYMAPAKVPTTLSDGSPNTLTNRPISKYQIGQEENAVRFFGLSVGFSSLSIIFCMAGFYIPKSNKSLCANLFPFLLAMICCIIGVVFFTSFSGRINNDQYDIVGGTSA